MAKNKRFYAQLVVVIALAVFVAAPRVFACDSGNCNSFSRSYSSTNQSQYQSQKTDVAVNSDSSNKVDVHQNVEVYAKAEVNTDHGHSGCDHDCGCGHDCKDHDRVIKIYHKEIIINRLPVTGSSMLVLGGILVAAALAAFGAVKVIKRA